MNASAPPPSSRPVHLYFLDFLLAVAVLTLPVWWLFERVVAQIGPMRLRVTWGYKPVVFLLLILVARVIASVMLRKRGQSIRGWAGHPAVGPLLAGVLLIFVLLWGWEKKLERAGFSAELPGIVIVGEERADPLKSKYHYNDPELLWRWRPGVMFNGRKVNAMGFLDREVDPVKPPGARRIICLGCSCTGQGPPAYSEILHNLLNAEEPGKWDAFNMGVHGYSTSQGLRLFQNSGEELTPDIVTLFFGWNDHWRARAEDSKRMARRTAKWQAPLILALHKKRFFQYIVQKSTPTHENILASEEFVLRVPPEEYRSNLLQFIDEIKKTGAIPVLIAAPRAKTLTPILVKNRQAASVQSALELHDRYLAILYEVAKATDTRVVDLAEKMTPSLALKLMSEDGIHFKAAGLEWIGAELHHAVRELHPLPAR